MPENEGAEVQATESAKKKADELGVSLTEVTGTGSGGQVTVDDVKRAAAEEGKGSDAKLVTLHPDFGVGEYKLRPEGTDEVVRVLSGRENPVGAAAYDAIPKNDDGSLKHPFVEVEREDS